MKKYMIGMTIICFLGGAGQTALIAAQKMTLATLQQRLEDLASEIITDKDVFTGITQKRKAALDASRKRYFDDARKWIKSASKVYGSQQDKVSKLSELETIVSRIITSFYKASQALKSGHTSLGGQRPLEQKTSKELAAFAQELLNYGKKAHDIASPIYDLIGAAKTDTNKERWQLLVDSANTINAVAGTLAGLLEQVRKTGLYIAPQL